MAAATALLCQPPSISKILTNPLNSRPQSTSFMNQKLCQNPEKSNKISCNYSKPTSENAFPMLNSVETTHLGKRELMLFGLSSSVSMFLSTPGSNAAVEVEKEKMALFVDDINAYSFMYPLELPSKKFVFKWVESRKPERYSSAAPLSPDAKMRIVSERVDIIDNLIISVSIGPPNSQFIASADKKEWNAKDVADSVLSYKSALRVTSAERKAESQLLETRTSQIDGEPYWYYEYLVRKSPTNSVQESNIFRRYAAVTAERDGFLYSLNTSTLDKKWDMMGPVLEKTVSSFRLLPPTDNYVSPGQDPWRFW
ncbi:psbP domain-containing protein 5, chloroplastic-like [Papaver somniferum]|nr:psbP domain-containing protein 5, chloroplastic-like [Papaver somniferum]